MNEICEFRISEKFAYKLFSDSEGKRLGDSVRKITISTNDPRFADIGRLQREIRSEYNRPFFFGWSLKRSYSKRELAEANHFRLAINSVFEPAAEECGTEYEESAACPICGAGAVQVSPLYLNIGKIPKNKDFSRTIAGEVVVSKRVKELFDRHSVSGVSLLPILINRKSSAESQDWFQLTIRTANAKIISPTRAGSDPFDNDEKGEYRCQLGDLLGLGLLSEVTLQAETIEKDDFENSIQFIGIRRGLLRPSRITIISPKIARLIESEKLKGCQIEVVHSRPIDREN